MLVEAIGGKCDLDQFPENIDLPSHNFCHQLTEIKPKWMIGVRGRSNDAVEGGFLCDENCNNSIDLIFLVLMSVWKKIPPEGVVAAQVGVCYAQ